MGEGNEVILNDGNFELEVIKSDKPVLVDFWAEWCGPCRMIAPLVEELAGEYSGKVKVCKMNVDEGRETAGSLGIMNIPTLLLFKDGKEVDRIVGVVPKNDIEARLNTVM